MPRKSYGRPSYTAVVATLALVFSIAALCVGGAMATGVIITGKQIKNGTITAADIHKGGVKAKNVATNAIDSADIKADAVQSSDIGEGQVDSGDIGEGQVTPEDVTMPAPVQLHFGSATAEVGTEFERVASVGTYSKVAPSSDLEVTWTGTAKAPNVNCVFQLRVDGQPSAENAGLVFVEMGSAASVSATALFTGLSAGTHAVEVWAHSPGAPFPCTIGPAEAEIPTQSFVVSEHVL